MYFLSLNTFVAVRLQSESNEVIGCWLLVIPLVAVEVEEVVVIVVNAFDSFETS